MSWKESKLKSSLCYKTKWLTVLNKSIESLGGWIEILSAVLDNMWFWLLWFTSFSFIMYWHLNIVSILFFIKILWIIKWSFVTLNFLFWVESCNDACYSVSTNIYWTSIWGTICDLHRNFPEEFVTYFKGFSKSGGRTFSQTAVS